MRNLLLAILLLLALPMQGQIELQGKVFKETKKASHHVKDTIVTDYFYEDKNGNSYQIILNKASGACYIWKKRVKKAGYYPVYMKPEVSQIVASKFNIEYKPKSK